MKFLPQILYLILVGLALGIIATHHGKPKTGNENFGVSLIAVLIQIGLMLWGGFFNVFFSGK
jgi:hypothetical protein